MNTRRSAHPTAGASAGRRLTAFVLALVFLLQSAASAGSGCVARVLAGGCCCAAQIEPQAAVERPSCCAGRSGSATGVEASAAGTSTGETSMPAHDADSGPRLAPGDECGCVLAPAPNAPADRSGTCADQRARDKRALDASDGFATWIASADVGLCAAPPSIDLPPPLGPPGPLARTASTVALSRLADRGVLGLLSEICTVRL